MILATLKHTALLIVSLALCACGDSFEAKTLKRHQITSNSIDSALAEQEESINTSNPRVSPEDPAETSPPSPPASTLILVSDRFWDIDTANYPVDFISEIKTSILSMPSTLKSKNLSSAQRALQLQWALKIANESSAQNVEIWVQKGEYDFSTITTAHVSTPNTGNENLYLPKLFIGRSNVRIVANQSTNPLFYYKGAGKDGTHHGRVFLMIKNKLNNIKIERIDFQGDHSNAKKEDVTYYVHENNTALFNAESGKYSYGMMMIGYEGGKNDVTIDGCNFSAINFAGISLVGDVKVTNSSFKGIIGEPVEGFQKYYDSIGSTAYDAVNSRMGFVGMAFGVGIRAMSSYGTLIITKSAFRNLVEGIVGVGIGDNSKIDSNTFSTFQDHAIYLLGPKMRKSSISNNYFEKSYGSALKLSGWANDYGHPLDGSASFQNLTIQANTFKNVLGAKIEMTGIFCTIRDNVIYNYDYSGDPNGLYNPARERYTGSNYPDFWFGHFSGGDGFYNHFAFNKVENNTIFGNQRLLQIFLHHDASLNPANDRSLGFNSFSGGYQYVSYRKSTSSWSAPLLDLNSSQLTLGTFENCASCRPETTGYLSDITVDWSSLMRTGDTSAYLVKYKGSSDIYMISADGIHERVNPAGRIFEVLAIADLDGDGYDEVYSRESGNTKIYGSKPYKKAYLAIASTLDQWTFADAGSNLIGFSVSTGSQGSPGTFYAVFKHAANRIYTNNLRSDGAAHVLGQVYSYNGGVSALPANQGSWLISNATFNSGIKNIFKSVFKANSY